MASLYFVFQTKLFCIYFVLDVLDSITYSCDLITSVIIWNLNIELLLEIHDKLNDVE